jgi:hypothetical protein
MYFRVSISVEGHREEQLQSEERIQEVLVPDGYKFRSGEAHVFSGEPRTHFEFKLKVDEKRRTLTKFDKT